MKLMKTGKVDVSKRAGWVWKNWIPEGSPTTVFGDGGKGKSLTLLAVMRSVITGEPLPDGSLPLVTGNCLIISGEDSKEEITSRLNAMGGGSGKYGDIFVMEDEDAEEFTVPGKWTELQKAIEDNDIVFWAIDPIFNFVESKVKTINDSNVRMNIFTPMKRIMSATNSTGIVLSHMNKDRKGNTASRASGSGAFVNAVRSTIAVMDTPGHNTFLMGVPKTNRAGVVNPIEYSLHENKAHAVVSIVFEHERPDLAHYFNGREEGQDNSQLGKAIAMFNQLLANGPMDSKPLRDAIVAATSLDTFNKAKKAVGAESKKVGAKWVTSFPTPISVTPVTKTETSVSKKVPARKALPKKAVVKTSTPKTPTYEEMDRLSRDEVREMLSPAAYKLYAAGRNDRRRDAGLVKPKPKVALTKPVKKVRPRVARTEATEPTIRAQKSKWTKPLSEVAAMSTMTLFKMQKNGEFTEDDYDAISEYREQQRQRAVKGFDTAVARKVAPVRAKTAQRPSQRAREHSDSDTKEGHTSTGLKKTLRRRGN